MSTDAVLYSIVCCTFTIGYYNSRRDRSRLIHLQLDKVTREIKAPKLGPRE